MDQIKLEDLLSAVKEGQVSVEDALKRLGSLPFEDLDLPALIFTAICGRVFPKWSSARIKPLNRS